MDYVKAIAFYSAIILFFTYGIYQAYVISKRTGKSVLWHICGLSGTRENITRKEYYVWLVITLISVLLLAFGIDHVANLMPGTS